MPELNVPDLVRQPRPELIGREHAERLLRDAQRELALGVGTHGEVDRGAGQNPQSHRAAVAWSRPDP